MTKQSHAHLPAGKVVLACRGALADIEDSRAEVLAGLVETRRRRGFPPWRRPYERAYRMLTEPEHEIVRLHRAEEERRVLDLHALARAACGDDPSFRIHVSVGDFIDIRRWYQPGADVAGTVEEIEGEMRRAVHAS